MEADAHTLAKKVNGAFQLMHEPGGEGAAAKNRFEFLINGGSSGNKIKLCDLQIIARPTEFDWADVRAMREAVKLAHQHAEQRSAEMVRMHKQHQEELAQLRQEHQKCHKQADYTFWQQTCATLNSEIEVLKSQNAAKDAQIVDLQENLQAAVTRGDKLQAELTEQQAVVAILQTQIKVIKPKAPTRRQRDCLTSLNSTGTTTASKVVRANCARSGWLDGTGKLTALGLHILAQPVPVQKPQKPRTSWKSRAASLRSALVDVSEILATTVDANEAVSLVQDSIANLSYMAPEV